MLSHFSPTLCEPMDYSQAPLSMGFSRQEYQSGLPFPPSRDLPDPGIEPKYLHLLHWQGGSSPLMPLGKQKTHGDHLSVLSRIKRMTLRMKDFNRNFLLKYQRHYFLREFTWMKQWPHTSIWTQLPILQIQVFILKRFLNIHTGPCLWKNCFK